MKRPDVVAHTHNPSTQEVDAERWRHFQGPPRLHSEFRTARAIQRDPVSNNKETVTKDDEQDCNPTEHLYLKYLRFHVNLGKSLIKYPGVLSPEKPILFYILSTTQRHGRHLLVFSDGIRPLSPHPHPDHHHQKENKKERKTNDGFRCKCLHSQWKWLQQRWMEPSKMKWSRQEMYTYFYF